MSFLKIKKTKRFFSLIFLLILILILTSNQIYLKAKTNETFQLKAKGYCGFNYLEWEPVEGANRYWIYRGVGEGKEESMPLTDFPIKETYYMDTKNIVAGTKYCYIVKAVDINAKEFATSNEACAIPTCSSELPEEECKLILQFQIGNKYYWVNGVQKGPMLTAPIIRWDRTFLIIRHVVEEVGGTISWDGANQIVTIITKEGKRIEFQIGNNKYKVNGVSKQIDPYNPKVVPFILEGRTLIPLRVTGEELNAKEINWYGDKQIAELIFPVPCPKKPKAKIDVYLPENCIKGTYIEIYDLKGNPITIIKEFKNGAFSTDCTIPCPGKYIVKPINPNCKFYPETQTVEFNEKECCLQSKRVDFKCECEEIKYGRIIVKMPEECSKDTKITIYDSKGDVVWEGGVNEEGVFDTDCKLKCPGEYKVVPFNPNKIFNPESQLVTLKDCCPNIQVVEFNCLSQVQITQKICGCIVRMGEKPDENGNYQVYIKLNCKEGDPVYDLVLNFPQSLLDSVNGYTILDYYNKFPHPVPSGLGCVYVIYNPLTKVVIQWEAHPDKKPCCEEAPSKGGRIIVKMPKECLDGTIVTIFDDKGNVAWSGKANENGVFDTDCTLPCPGIYKVFPQNDKCKFDPVSQVVKVDCCPNETVVGFECKCEEKKGRIVVSVPKECIEGTVIHIIDSYTNVEVLTGKLNEKGIFDTDCTLPCPGIYPGIYKVRPENKNCTFNPPEIKVIMDQCCPQYYEAKFECKCEEKYGWLQVKIPKDCVQGTSILIYDSSGKLVMKLTPNSDGIADTYCKLPCPGIYIVKPYNPNCKFDPEEKRVEILNCCDPYTTPFIHTLEFFKCECAGQKMGRIDVKLPKSCLSAKVEIYDSKGNLIYRLSDDGNGYFTTGCTLPCPGQYIVKPYNPNCTFKPESKVVELTQCCPNSYQYLEFECSCIQMGRIIVYITGNCPSDTTVEIYNMNNVKVATLTRNAQGYYDSLCTIPCNQQYIVRPYNPKCKFDPSLRQVTLPCCPDYLTLEFRCACTTSNSSNKIVNFFKNILLSLIKVFKN